MVASFSPHRDAGGTLHLPSPSGMHHVHPNSAINQLRRSLSRSPSKGSDFRLITRPDSPSAKHSHYISSPLSPSRRSHGNLFFVPATSAPSPLAVPYPPSARINRPALRRHGNLQTSRVRTTPSSPAKRVLSDSKDQGNASVMNGSSSSSIEEKHPKLTSNETADESTTIGKTTHNDALDNNSAPKSTAKMEKRRSGNFGPFPATSSPLKRSDGIMNLDQAGQEIPSVKRRSLHGASCGPDFDVFDFGSAVTTPNEPSSSQPVEPDQSASTFSPVSPLATTIPKRSSSLRRSTLQQRQSDRSIFSRARQGVDNTPETPPGSPMVLRSRQRTSSDSHFFQSRDTQTSSHNLFSTSNPPLFGPSNTPGQPQHAAHPLSRTITQSSSGSSLADDSPTHEPIHANFDRPKPVLNFSKSLPVGSTRPLGPSQLRQESSNDQPESLFATPENYKLVKPLPAAFMSTGLISKKNRNPEDAHNVSIGSKNMPDTPCKRPNNIIPAVSKPSQPKVKAKPHPQPSGPFSSSFKRPGAPSNPTPFTKGMGIFGNSFSKPALPRRGSIASIEGDDPSQSQSPSGNHDRQSTLESDLPPTPTKQALPSRLSEASEPQQHRQQTSFDALSYNSGPSCKFSPIQLSPIDSDEESDFSPEEESPSTGPSVQPYKSNIPLHSSLPRSRPLQNLNSPSPLSRKPFPKHQRHHRNSQVGVTKTSLKSIASPLGCKTARHATPHTPQDHIFPPDPSGLSISANNYQSLNPSDHNTSILPATPTAPRESFAQVGKRQSLQLSGYSAPDVDPCLTERFEKVELVGTGEFSQVYRVSQSQPPSSCQIPFALSSKKPSPSKPRLEQVWAVKKSKQPIAGTRDRQRRQHEVDVLKALSNSDYIISYADSWEENNYLYIQTEFCEEGSLDVFLSQVGLKARLDDFRIWKILLELSQVSTTQL